MAFKPHTVGTVWDAADANDLAGLYDRSTTEVDVTNTVAETTLYTKVITAGHMSTDRQLWLHIDGDYLRNAAVDFTYRVKFGGVAHAGASVGTGVTSATRAPFSLWLRLANLGTTNSNFLEGELLLGAQAALSVAGVGGTNVVMHTFASNGAMTVDTSVAATLEVTATWASASTSVSVRKKRATLLLL